MVKCKILYLSLLTLLLLSNPATLSGQSAGENYINHKQMLSSDGTRYVTTVNYFDGIGRMSQTSSNGLSPTGRYAASAVEYDSRGNAVREWLPAIVGATPKYVGVGDLSSKSSATYSDESAYTDKEYDALGRVVSVLAPGKDLHAAGKKATFAYSCNQAGEVRLYTAPCDGSNLLGEEGFYKAGTLYKTTSTDEDGRTVTTFKDMNDRTVLERRGTDNDTYFVYDIMGNLRFVLSPQYQQDPDLEGLCYEYRYDGKKRCIWKRLPGCEPVEMRYDSRDRMAFMQDGLLREKGKWRFFLYDSQSRPCLQGLCLAPITDEAAIPSVSFIPAFAGQCGTLYSTARGTIPLHDATLEKVCYYDAYTFLNFQGPHGKSPFVGYMRKSEAGNPAQAMLTGTATFEADTLLTCSAIYYDSKCRPCDVRQVFPDGDLLATLTEYSFTDKPLKVTNTLTHRGQAYPAVQEYQYCQHTDRILSEQVTASGTTTVTTSNQYDKLGRLSVLTHGDGISSQRLKYNVRGWLTQSSGSDFSEWLSYTPAGRVKKQKWTNGPEGTVRSYSMTYDKLGRLTKALYGEDGTANNAFTEQMTYNANGGVTKVLRYSRSEGITSGEYDTKETRRITLDGNQPSATSTSVQFNSSPAPGVSSSVTKAGMLNQPSALQQLSLSVGKMKSISHTFKYNANGSLEQDDEKGIAHISYHATGMPRKVQFSDGSSTEYVYDADGNHLSTVHLTAVPGISVSRGQERELTAAQVQESDTTHYIGPFELRGDRAVFRFDGGHIYIPFAQTYQPRFFYYHVKDHLGNVRVTKIGAGEGGSVLQRMNYYPFGGMYEAEDVTNNAMPWKFGGKELDQMHGLDLYDFHARPYDARLGQFTMIDPCAEKYYYVSPYVYCLNNPIRYVDPDGKKVYLYATTLPGTNIPFATHTFIVITDNKDNVKKYYAFGSEYDGIKGATGGRLMQRRYNQDINVYNGNDTEHIKAKIPILTPANMKEEEFENRISEVAESFGNNESITYMFIPIKETQGNCNTSSSTILLKSGLSEKDLENLKTLIPGVVTGFDSYTRPWTKKEQDEAVSRERKVNEIKKGIGGH